MAGRRFFTLTAMAAALVLITSVGTSWAQPGDGHRHPKRHAQVKAHGHSVQSNGAMTESARSANTTTTWPTTTTDTSDRTTNQRGHAFGRTHVDLASHPGKALGLFKHAPQPPTQTPQPANSPPSGPTGGGGEPVPTSAPQPPTQPAPTTANGNHSAPPPATEPPTVPPTGQPTIPRDSAGLAQVLLHSNPAEFTALPIVVVAVLALAVCGLIGLARLRA